MFIIYGSRVYHAPVTVHPHLMELVFREISPELLGVLAVASASGSSLKPTKVMKPLAFGVNCELRMDGTTIRGTTSVIRYLASCAKGQFDASPEVEEWLALLPSNLWSFCATTASSQASAPAAASVVASEGAALIGNFLAASGHDIGTLTQQAGERAKRSMGGFFAAVEGALSTSFLTVRSADLCSLVAC